MVKTYFTYNVQKANNEGTSKAFLSTDAGGGSFLFTDKIISSKPIEDSADGNIKVVKSYSREEFLAGIAGIEESKERNKNYYLKSSEETNHSNSSSYKNNIVDKISEMRAHFESHDEHIAASYDREETILGFEGKLSRQRLKKNTP